MLLALDKSGYNKVLARETVDPEEPLVSCPENLIIGPKNARKLYPEMDSAVKPQSYVKLSFLHEFRLGSKSCRSRYISLLPQSAEETIPIFYNKQAHRLIQGTNLGSEFAEKITNWKKEFAQCGGADKGFTEEEYIWASTIFTSRSFPASLIYPDEDKLLSMLIPFVDFLNHKPYTLINWDAHDGKNFRLVAGETVAEGQEAFNNYGAKGNEELLLGYGFCIKNNPFDTVPLKLGFNPKVLAYCKERGVDVPVDGVYYLHGNGVEVPRELIGAFTAIGAYENNYYHESTVAKLQGLEMLRNALLTKSRNVTQLTEPFDENDMTQVFACWYTDGVRAIYKSSIEYCEKQIARLIKDPEVFVCDILSIDNETQQLIIELYGCSSVEELVEKQLDDDVALMILSMALLKDKIKLPLPEASNESIEDFQGYFESWKQCSEVFPEFGTSKWSPAFAASVGEYFSTKVPSYQFTSNTTTVFRGVIDL